MASKSGRWREILLYNKGLKAASLVLAFVTWCAIRSVINFETMVSDIPLTIQVNPGWAILDRSAKTVDVLFRGSQEDIRYLSRDQVKIDVDIRNKPFAKALTVKLLAKNVQGPGAVRAAMIWPDEITLKLDQESEKYVPVKADLQGVVPEGYAVDKVTCAPASILLQGPRQRLDEIESVRTAPIDLEDRIRSFKKLKMPVVSPSENWVGRVSPSHVGVEISIVERSMTRELQNLPVTALIQPGSRPRLDLWPLKVNVVLKGVAELLRNVKPEEMRAIVDCSELEGTASYNLPVRIQAPAGITAVGIEPPTVKVTVGDL